VNNDANTLTARAYVTEGSQLLLIFSKEHDFRAVVVRAANYRKGTEYDE
jgi:hypothetical protein